MTGNVVPLSRNRLAALPFAGQALQTKVLALKAIRDLRKQTDQVIGALTSDVLVA